MENEKKNRSRSQFRGGNDENRNERRDHLQGPPTSSYRNTGGNKRHEKDDSSRGAEKNTTKKGSNI